MYYFFILFLGYLEISYNKNKFIFYRCVVRSRYCYCLLKLSNLASRSASASATAAACGILLASDAKLFPVLGKPVTFFFVVNFCSKPHTINLTVELCVNIQ